MKRFCTTVASVVGFGCGWIAAAGPFEPGKEREWEFLDQAKFRGTMVGFEDGKVQIRMADGAIRDFWPGGAEAIHATYLQRCVTKLPATPAKPPLRPGSGPWIDLTAVALPAGPLRQWKNGGRAGGSFLAMNVPPSVAQVQGRKAVVFEHPPWLLPLEFQSMVSDFHMPESAISGGSLTLVAWLCNLGPVVDRETFFCWGEKDCGELDTPDFSYGCYEAMQWYDDKLAIPPARFPKLGQWHQFAFVVTPSDKDRNRLRLDLYVNGTRVAGKLVRKPNPKVLSNNLAFLGCAWEAWWGHAWETRPARPYTGAIAGLQVYDRALELAEIRKLGGFAAGALDSGAAEKIAATEPEPADGSKEVQAGIERLHWRPHPDAVAQVLHIGTDRDAVAKGSATKVRLKNQVEDAFVPLDLKLPELESGTTYYWRVEQVTEPPLAADGGEPWSFTTSAYDLEFDGPVSEAFPPEVQQDGFYNRWMDAGGYPVISPPGNEDIHLRAARHALRKLLDKRPDLVKALQGSHAATHLASKQNRGWGWSHFVCSSYGEGEAILREGAILMHEMGHQFHMQGAEQMEPDFRHRLAAVFRAGRRERLWMGDYGGRNMWENVAVCASWWINDMTQDEDGIRPRELLRISDPRIYHLLADYWPGDTMIELHPREGGKADAAGRVIEWRNRGGIEYFRPNTGWRFYQRSVGAFKAAGNGPALASSGGVSAVKFGGGDGLTWDQVTWDSLDGNRSWSVDGWFRRETAANGEEALIEWGAQEGNPAVKLLWGATEDSCRIPGIAGAKWKQKPGPGSWHHLTWVFTGGGVSDGEGELRVYVDGQPDHVTRAKLALPASARVVAGRGYTGAIGHLRIHNYDLHPLQIAEMHKREAPVYQRAGVNPVGRLWVDLDPGVLASPYEPDTCPLYPASLEKPWLRSWVNLGLSGGKFHNDATQAGVSQPRLGVMQGTNAVVFDGKSRMIASFAGPVPQAATVEMWACAEAAAGEGTILQWGPLAVPARLARPGAWHHLALTVDKGTLALFVDGTQASTARLSGTAGVADRLLLGAGGTGKAIANGFRGGVAGLRVHDVALTAQQVQQVFRQGRLQGALAPDPGDDSRVVVARQPALRWQLAAGLGGGQADVYLGTRPEEVATAKRGSALHLGRHAPGGLRPRLQPGTRYYWRVDPLDGEGAVKVAGPVWTFRTAEGAVLDLDAADLRSGPVQSWRNKGRAGGEFAPGTERELWRPSVARVDGLKGVDFGGRKALVSTFATPAGLTGKESFTVSLWGYCPDQKVLEREQTVMAWGRRPKERAEFRWGSSEKNGAFMGGAKAEFGFAGSGGAPLPGAWRHLAYVYDARAGKLRVYSDGRLNREEEVRLAIADGDSVCLGGARTGKLADSPFGGLLGGVAVAPAALGDAEIARLAQGMPVDKVHRAWLVRLEAKDLPEGVLDAWPNTGSLGGSFVPEQETPGVPDAGQVAGRAAVSFNGQAGFLRSSLPTPPALVGDTPFTVEMWLHNPKLAEVETVFAMAPSVAMKSFLHESIGRAANFNFGAARESGRDLRPGLFNSGPIGRNVGWKEAPAVTPEWHHVAWVYGGGFRGNLKVYLDGKPVAERGFCTLDTIGGWPMHIGTSWNTARGSGNLFSGALASLRAFDYAKTGDEILAAAAGK